MGVRTSPDPIRWPLPKITAMARIQLVDIARGIAILLVLFGHAIEVFFQSPHLGPVIMTVWKFIYSFHVPLFYFLSGVVAPRGSVARIIRSSVRLLLLAQWVDFPALILSSTLLGAGTPATQILLNGLTLSGQTLIVTWFLASLALIQLISIVYDRGGIPLKVGLWILLILAFFLHAETLTNFFQVGSLFAGFLFYRFGLAARKSMEWLDSIKIRTAIPLVGFLALLLAFTLDAENRGCPWALTQACPNIAGRFVVFLFNGDMGQIPVFIAAAFLGILGSLGISKSLSLKTVPTTRILRRIGENSLLLLIINGYFLIFFEKNQAVMSYFSAQESLTHALTLAAGMVFLQLCLALLFRTPFSWLDRLSFGVGDWLVKRLPISL
jgi:acyltransferase